MMRRMTRTHIAAGMLALLSIAPAGAQTIPPKATGDRAGGTTATTAVPGTPPALPQAKPAEAVPGGRLGPPGVPQAIRWTEDWSRPVAADASPLERLRHLSLGGDAWLSIGGEVRIYSANWNHATIGLRPNDDNSLVQSRLRLIGDLHVGSHLRAFVELGDNREYGAEVVTPPNRDRPDVQQAFVDVTLPLGDAGQVTVRPGRFELTLGNGKLVAVREGANLRFTYQGVRGTYILPGRISIDLFAVRPIDIRPGGFDDRPNRAASFDGVYVSVPDGPFGIGTDVYHYDVRRDRVVLSQGAGAEDRRSWGVRLWKRKGPWDGDLEALIQTGRFADKDIRAWGVLFEGGYTLADLPMAPRIGLRANAFSGDGNPADGTVRTFQPVAPRLTLYSEAGFFNFANMVDAYPSLTVKPARNLLVMAGPDLLWRQRRGDGVYNGPSNVAFAPYRGTNRVGTAINLEATWTPTPILTFRLYETYFSPSDGFRTVGGRRGNYLGVLGDLRF